MFFIEPLLQKGGAEWFCDQVPSITSMAFAHPSEIGQVSRNAEVYGLRRSTQATGTDVAAFHPETEAVPRVSTPVIQIELVKMIFTIPNKGTFKFHVQHWIFRKLSNIFVVWFPKHHPFLGPHVRYLPVLQLSLSLLT